MPKNDYTLIVFFPNKVVKKWTYVHKLNDFQNFLNKKFPDWEYLNIYERRTREFIQRVKKGELMPAFNKATT